MIFLSITGSFASAVLYDKYQTRRVKQKWTDLVSHLADEKLDTHTMPRKLTIYLSAPPGDGLRSAREHFHNYIKPILVAGAMDWDVVEGRKEGDVRFKTAERVRRKRKRAGEGEPLEGEELGKEEIVAGMRDKQGTREWEGLGGDLVVGRHTWKEYVRGLHEGWLGPADAPKTKEAHDDEVVSEAKHVDGVPSLGDAAVKGAANMVEANIDPAQPSGTDASPTTTTSEEECKPVTEEEKKEDEPPKPRQPPPYITPSEYPMASLSPHTPEVIGPSTAIKFPHLLGIRNTPIRIYRFLNRRRLADDVGREVAAAVLGSYSRPYATTTTSRTSDSLSPSMSDGDGAAQSELEGVLQYEEREWWKTVRQPRKPHEEGVWIEDMVCDDRIVSRMRAWQLSGEDEERAKRLADGTEKIERKEESWIE